MQTQRRQTAYTILRFLAESGIVMIDALLPPQYPEAQLARMLLGLHHRRPEIRRAAKHSRSSMLYYLKQQGLVRRSGSRRKSSWNITPKGRKWLRTADAAIAVSHDEYQPAPLDGIPRLLTFDIPEKLRRKRDWLRTQLFACGFVLLQKSVYIGYRPLPEELMKEIDDLGLSKTVHLVSIEKQGTLTKRPGH
ncbi:MAG: hypothetical protein AAB533_03570 [Patescibacteria group bacterium]